jgi:hypothetical protein
LDTIIRDISRGVQIRSRLALFCEHFSFVSSIEPKKIEEALKDVDWLNTMHEELNNFTRNQAIEESYICKSREVYQRHAKEVWHK